MKNKTDFSTEVAESIIGTCDHISAHIEYYNEKHATKLTEDGIDWAVFEDITFLCYGCHWYCEISEMSDNEEETNCKDCYDGEDND